MKAAKRMITDRAIGSIDLQDMKACLQSIDMGLRKGLGPKGRGYAEPGGGADSLV